MVSKVSSRHDVIFRVASDLRYNRDFLTRFGNLLGGLLWLTTGHISG